MQIKLLNMYNLYLQTHMLWDIEKKNKQPYLPNYTPIDSAESFKPDRVRM